MFTIHLLGHLYISCRNTPVRLSLKALGLITYLALEATPQHRERLAELLWPSADAHKNLRVELARIRAAGLDIFPRSSKILFLEGFQTDLNLWRDQPPPQTAEELTAWLAVLRGLPLSGLEDIGDAALQDWVEQQRFHLQSQVEQHLSHMHALYQQSGMTWATQQLANRAAATGYELHEVNLNARPELSLSRSEGQGPGTPERQESAALNSSAAAFDQALSLARQGHPMTILVYGPLGIGKSYLVREGLKRCQWLELYAPSSRAGRLVLASLAQQLLAHTDETGRTTLRSMLQHPGSLEEDIIKLSVVLGDMDCPVGIVLDHAHAAGVELASLMEFLLHSPARQPRALIIMSRQSPEHVKLARSLLRRFPASQSYQLAVMPLSLTDVERIVQEQGESRTDPTLNAAHLLQLSEGNPLHLLGHLDHVRQGERPSHAAGRWTQLVRERYLGEVDGWTPEFRKSLEQLSVINGSFDLPQAAAALRYTLPDTEELLRMAVNQGVLVQESPGVALQLPLLAPVATSVPAGPGTQQSKRYQFRFEGLRVVLAGLIDDDSRARVRQHLIQHLHDTQPGLALYYAERAGLTAETMELQSVYHRHLPTVSPLHQSLAQAPEPQAIRVPAPPVRTAPPVTLRVWDGYLISWSEQGWLHVVSQGRSGPPSTLTLQLPLPAKKTGLDRSGSQGQITIRLVWRVEVYNPGLQFNPVTVPFALRLQHSALEAAAVFAPEVSGAYREDGALHQAMPGVVTGKWMEHEFRLPDTATGIDAVLTLSCRAMDLSLTIGQLEVGGVDVLTPQQELQQPRV